MGCTITTYKKKWYNKQQLLNIKEESEDQIQWIKGVLIALIFGEHHPTVDKEGNMLKPHEYILSEFNELFEELGDQFVNRSLAQTAEDYPEDVEFED